MSDFESPRRTLTDRLTAKVQVAPGTLAIKPWVFFTAMGSGFTTTINPDATRETSAALRALADDLDAAWDFLDFAPSPKISIATPEEDEALDEMEQRQEPMSKGELREEAMWEYADAHRDEV